MKHRSTKRVLGLTVAALVAAGTLAGCSTSEGDEGSNVVRITLANHVWTDIVKSKIPEFEKATGLKVELTQLGEDQLSDQYNVKLNAGTDEIDVMMYRPLQEGKLFAQNDYLADLGGYVDSNAEWDWSDFQPGPVEATTFDGTVVGVPLITEQEVMYYRTDLLEAAGLEVPTTFAEMQNAAKVISEANPGIAGFVARTGRSAAVTQFSSYLFSFGGQFIDKDGNSAIDSQAARDAYAYYGGMLNQYGPENISTDMSWPDAAAIFAQGNAAFYTDASSLYKNVVDADKSTIGEHVGFAPLPAGPAGAHPYDIPSWALAINEASNNKDNAWKFIEWATSAETTLAVQEAGVPGARASVWADPAGTASFPAQLAEAIAASSKGGVGHDRPLVISVAEAREIVGMPIVVAITGGDVDAAIDEAHAQFQAFLDAEK